MTIDEYAKAVAEAVRAHCEQEARDCPRNGGSTIGNVIAGIRLDAIIASVPKPEAQHHDAPTCGGYTREHAVAELRELTRSAMALLETSDGEKLPAAIRRLGEALIPFAWALDEHESGPLLPPDTTEPRRR